jgi:hypothetical protein
MGVLLWGLPERSPPQVDKEQKMGNGSCVDDPKQRSVLFQWSNGICRTVYPSSLYLGMFGVALLFEGYDFMIQPRISATQVKLRERF